MEHIRGALLCTYPLKNRPNPAKQYFLLNLNSKSC